MKARFQSAIGVIAVLAVGVSPRVLAGPEDDAKAARIMKQAREALGGEAKLKSLQALSLRAEFRREATAPIPGGGATFVMMGGGGGTSGSGQVSGTLAIDICFPDKFYREESSTGGLSLTRVDGFEGNRPFLDITSNSPGTRIMASAPADDPERVKAALKRTNTDLARLLLGLVAGTHAAMPVTYAYAGQAESPDTVADMIEVTGPNDFKARLFIDQQTRLPLMLTFVEQERQPVRMTMPRGERGGRGSDAPRHAPAPGAAAAPRGLDDLSPEQRAALERRIQAAQAAPPKMVEYRLFFSDYREVGGLRLPHEISRATAEKTTEEWQVKEYTVNPDIKADRFKVGAK